MKDHFYTLFGLELLLLNQSTVEFVSGWICEGGKTCRSLTKRQCESTSGGVCEWNIWLRRCDNLRAPVLCDDVRDYATCQMVGCTVTQNQVCQGAAPQVQESAECQECKDLCAEFGDPFCGCSDVCSTRTVGTCDHLQGSWKRFSDVDCSNPYLPCAINEICCPSFCFDQYGGYKACKCPSMRSCPTPTEKRALYDEEALPQHLRG